MAFFEKLGDMAKNLGDKTGDAIETNKLNGKIKSEKSAIDEVLKQIGAFYLERHAAGEATEDGIAEYMAAIDGHNAAIAEAEAQIQKIRDENEAEKAAAETGAGVGAAVSAAAFSASFSSLIF